MNENKYFQSLARNWDILPFWFKAKIYLMCLFYAWRVKNVKMEM